jgi:hypothetical protein
MNNEKEEFFKKIFGDQKAQLIEKWVGEQIEKNPKVRTHLDKVIEDCGTFVLHLYTEAQLDTISIAKSKTFGEIEIRTLAEQRVNQFLAEMIALFARCSLELREIQKEFKKGESSINPINN